MIEPLRLSFDVQCRIEHAFDVWTNRIDQWWPRAHSVSAESGLEVVVEPRVGGRIFERTPSGAEHDWGEVTLWQPPTRFGYLWHLRRDRADATEVDITFTPRTQSSTRVDIEHRGWERLGVEGPQWREANVGGWSALLPHYVAACTAAFSEAASNKDSEFDEREGTHP
jgi:hypothetical protein